MAGLPGIRASFSMPQLSAKPFPKRSTLQLGVSPYGSKLRRRPQGFSRAAGVIPRAIKPPAVLESLKAANSAPSIAQRFPKKDGWRPLYKKKELRDGGGGFDRIFFTNTKTGKVMSVCSGDTQAFDAAKIASIAAKVASYCAYLAKLAALEGLQRKVVLSAGLKLLVNHLYPLRRRLRARWLKRIQARVIALIGEDAPLVEVNLPEHKLELKASIKFEGASGAAETAAILDESIPLMDQINVAIDACCDTAKEFNIRLQHFKVVGHTSFSKKSIDGGIAVSTARAKAVVKVLSDPALGSSCVPTHILHPEGLGCMQPLKGKDKGSSANRRVEIGVMTDKEVHLLTVHEPRGMHFAYHHSGGTK